MSLNLCLTDLPIETKIKIERDLTVREKVKFRAQKGFSAPQMANELQFMMIDEFDSEILKVPYYYGTRLGLVNNKEYHYLPPITFIGELYPYQNEPYLELSQHLYNNNTASLFCYPGFGKTVVTAKLLSQLDGLTLILIQSKILIKQWLNTFADFTDAEVWVVGENMPATTGVIVCMEQRLKSIAEDYPDFISQVKNLVIDEVHTFCTPSRVTPILTIQPDNIIICSATPERSNGMDQMLKYLVHPDEVRVEFHRDFNVYRYNTGIYIDAPKGQRGLDWNKYLDNVISHEERNNRIVTLAHNNSVDYKVLILTWRVEHVMTIYNKLVELGVSCDYMAGTKDEYKDSDVLVGTFSKIGTGFDEKTACKDFGGRRINLLIIAGSMKSESLLIQVSGRAFRAENPNIVYFVDNTDVSKRHWRVASKWYRNHGGVIDDVSFTR